jgi:16S rRNA (uracil1498-N3)-methyltransferase
VTPPVFVIPDLSAARAGASVRLDGPEGRHAVTVRRLSVGEAVTVVDGRGRRVVGVVAALAGRDALDVSVTSVVDEPRSEPLLTVVQALPKGERGELAVEMLTEVGVDLIVPWSAATSVSVWKGERAERGARRWRDAASAAAKQARRAWTPDVAPLATTADVVSRVGAAACPLVLHEEATLGISDVDVPSAGEILVIVGPEGGITRDERTAFAAAGARAVRLGPSVLRTSTAGVAAAAVLLARTSRWQVADAPEMEG